MKLKWSNMGFGTGERTTVGMFTLSIEGYDGKWQWRCRPLRETASEESYETKDEAKTAAVDFLKHACADALNQLKGR